MAQLKRRGIDIDMNLLVSRQFTAADDLPREIESLDFKRQAVVGFFNPTLLARQQEYARQLLTHRNPYTRLTYAQDPAVAIVEVNNENGLLHAWLRGELAGLPAVYDDELRERWNRWLAKRYQVEGGASDEALAKAWGIREEPTGREMLDGGRGAWNLEQHDAAVAMLNGDASLVVRVDKAGSADWHVQLSHSGVKLIRGRLYTLTFRSRADRRRTLSVAAAMAHEPWESLGFYQSVTLSPG